MHTAAEVQRVIEAHLRGEFPQPPGRRYPAPPTKLVRVEALTATWCVGGQPVEVGQVYTVAEHDVDLLELRGKGRRI